MTANHVHIRNLEKETRYRQGDRGGETNKKYEINCYRMYLIYNNQKVAEPLT
jgi:hypothetical protein